MVLHRLSACLRVCFISTWSNSFHNYSHITRMIGHHYLRATLQRLKPFHLFKRHASSGAVKPLFLNVIKGGYSDRTAILDSHGSHTYEELICSSTALAQWILAVTPRDPALGKRGSGVILNGERVAILCPNNISFVISQCATWMSGCTAVPLCRVHPLSELDYIVRDSHSSVLIATREFTDQAHTLAAKHNLKLLILNEDAYSKKEILDSDDCMSHADNVSTSTQSIAEASNCNVNDRDLIEQRILKQKWSQVHWKNRKAMIVYTSGTTGPPKGVVQTFSSLQAQVAMMLQAWGWTSYDVILHVLPLHHVHGLVNVLACPLWCGATCVMMPEFNADKVRLLFGEGWFAINGHCSDCLITRVLPMVVGAGNPDWKLTGKHFVFSDHHSFSNLAISFHRLSIKHDRCRLYQYKFKRFYTGYMSLEIVPPFCFTGF